MWYIHIMEYQYSSAIKKKWGRKKPWQLVHAAWWVKLKSIVLGGKHQKQIIKCYVSIYMRCPVRQIERENRLMVDQGGGNEKCLQMSINAPFWGEEHVLKLDCGDNTQVCKVTNTD